MALLNVDKDNAIYTINTKNLKKMTLLRDSEWELRFHFHHHDTVVRFRTACAKVFLVVEKVHVVC